MLQVDGADVEMDEVMSSRMELEKLLEETQLRLQVTCPQYYRRQRHPTLYLPICSLIAGEHRGGGRP
jgi:hypothetical protein